MRIWTFESFDKLWVAPSPSLLQTQLNNAPTALSSSSVVNGWPLTIDQPSVSLNIAATQPYTRLYKRDYEPGDTAAKEDEDTDADDYVDGDVIKPPSSPTSMAPTSSVVAPVFLLRHAIAAIDEIWTESL